MPDYDTSFISGIDSLDAEHLELINALNLAIKEAKEKVMGTDGEEDTHFQLQLLATTFIKYLTQHFTTEEALMVKFNYPQNAFTKHKFSHRLMQEVYLVCLKNILSKTFTVSEVLDILDSQFMDHLANEDREFILFIKETRESAS